VGFEAGNESVHLQLHLLLVGERGHAGELGGGDGGQSDGGLGLMSGDQGLGLGRVNYLVLVRTEL